MTKTMGITINETLEPMCMGGSGASVICVIGNGNRTKELTTVYTFNSYDVAKLDHATYPGSIGPETPGSPLLSAVHDIFVEGAVTDATQVRGIDKVYCINVGASPTGADYTAACLLAQTLGDVEIELYVGLVDPTIMATLATAQVSLAGTGGYRHAIATAAPGATAATIAAYNSVALQKSRFLIHADPDMQATFAAKMACTDPSVDPAFGPYRTKLATDINIYTAPDMATLTNAGIICDQPAISDSDLAEPYMAVSTAWAQTTPPNDALIHCRRNADSFWRTTDVIAKALLKSNDLDVARGMAQQVGIGVLAQGVKDGKIIPKTSAPVDAGYMYTVTADPVNLFQLIINRKIRPVGSVYYIVENSIIQSPLAGT